MIAQPKTPERTEKGEQDEVLWEKEGKKGERRRKKKKEDQVNHVHFSC